MLFYDNFTHWQDSVFWELQPGWVVWSLSIFFCVFQVQSTVGKFQNVFQNELVWNSEYRCDCFMKVKIYINHSMILNADRRPIAMTIFVTRHIRIWVVFLVCRERKTWKTAFCVYILCIHLCEVHYVRTGFWKTTNLMDLFTSEGLFMWIPYY